MPIFLTFSRKTVVTVTVVAASCVLAGLFAYEVFAQPLSADLHANAPASVPAGTVYLSLSAHAAATQPANAPMLEMHIANNGLVLLRGARVLSLSGSSMRVGMSWGSGDFIWNVSTAYNTEFFNTAGSKETLADIGVGDIVTITGTLSAGGAGPGVAANIVRE